MNPVLVWFLIAESLYMVKYHRDVSPVEQELMQSIHREGQEANLYKGSQVSDQMSEVTV